MDAEWKIFLEEKRVEYARIGPIECPAFDNEKIYFTNTGFNHLIRKERKLREKSIRIRRVTLLQFAPGILKRSQNFITHFTNIDKKGVRVQFWSFASRVNGIELVVIVRQIDSNPKHFFSIFEQ